MTKTTKPLIFKFIETGETITITENNKTVSVSSGWFKLVQPNHNDKGIQLLLPLNHPQYSNEIQTTLKNLSQNETLQMRLAPKTSKNIQWRVYEINETEP